MNEPPSIMNYICSKNVFFHFFKEIFNYAERLRSVVSTFAAYFDSSLYLCFNNRNFGTVFATILKYREDYYLNIKSKILTYEN